MNVHVLKGYRGRPSNEQFIPPGVYSDDDERLFGLAAYLIENGHAIEIGIQTEPAAKPTIDPEPQAVKFLTEKQLGEADAPQSDGDSSKSVKAVPDLESLSLEDLKVKATELQLQFRSRASKPELIALIEAALAKDIDNTANKEAGGDGTS